MEIVPWLSLLGGGAKGRPGGRGSGRGAKDRKRCKRYDETNRQRKEMGAARAEGAEIQENGGVLNFGIEYQNLRSLLKWR